ncbi:MAG TPA: ATP-binding cassette domain-containing protein [Erysipelothrix sp.]
MILFENVSKSYPNDKDDFYAVKNLNLRIDKEEIFGIVGESGAGKSTILKLINQLEKQDKGRIFIDGEDIGALSKAKLQKKRQNIGVIFQNFNLLKNKTVYDNVAISLKMQNKINEEKILNALAFVSLLDKKDQYPATLSGGEKQRVAIARAIVSEPEILLCDEATSALDHQTTLEVLELLEKVQQTYKTTIVFITHELTVAKTLCDRVAIMEKGALKEVVSVNKMKRQKQILNYADYAKEVLVQ